MACRQPPNQYDQAIQRLIGHIFLIVRRCRPDIIHVDAPVPVRFVFVSSCLVSLIFVSGGNKTVITKCAITLHEYL